MYYVPVLSYRFPIVIDMFPTDMFRSRYPVISVSFSRPLFRFRFRSRQKKTGSGLVWGFSRSFPRPFSTLIRISKNGKISVKHDPIASSSSLLYRHPLSFARHLCRAHPTRYLLTRLPCVRFSFPHHFLLLHAIAASLLHPCTPCPGNTLVHVNPPRVTTPHPYPHCSQPALLACVQWWSNAQPTVPGSVR